MRDYRIIRYSSDYFVEWNNFIINAKNATFLFHRNFMEYHKDRFEDFSLLIFKGEKLLALLPANKDDNTIISHQGLSYGGLIFNSNLKFNVVIEVFSEILSFLNTNKIERLKLKTLPFIYTRVPNDEISYLFFILKAKMERRDTLSVINLEEELNISKNRIEGFKRGNKRGLIVKEEVLFDLFWNKILINNLKQRHNASPVHSLEEITLLKASFPKNIRQFNVYYNDEIVAGTTVFESKYVAHSQYISGNEKNNELGSLDFLHIHLIKEVFKNKKYFDFGSSNENRGLQINKGLQFWKEGFGARTVTQDFYNISTANYHLLNKVFI